MIYFCPKLASEAISEHLILGRACPQTFLVLQPCVLMHTYIDIHIPSYKSWLWACDVIGLWLNWIYVGLTVNILISLYSLTFCTEMSYIRQNVGMNSQRCLNGPQPSMLKSEFSLSVCLYVQLHFAIACTCHVQIIRFSLWSAWHSRQV